VVIGDLLIIVKDKRRIELDDIGVSIAEFIACAINANNDVHCHN
jgi:hypothetical protein